MTAIYDSPFLIALGWTIASSLWQAALLWLIYQVINSGGNRVSPALKHSVAASFLLISFGWFSVTFVQNYNEVAALKLSLKTVADSNISLAQALFNISAEASTGNRVFTVINNFLPYLSAAYLIVLVVLLIKLTRAYIFSVQLKTQGLIELNEQWINFVNTYALNIGISRKVKVFLSEKINVPATLDFFKPVILLPVATFNHLSVAQVESVLLHELAHIRRNDYLINIIASVIETVLFFNPFVHLLTKSLKKEREHCCDDLVLQYKFDPHSYASALLSLEKMRIGLQPLAVAATGESGQLLGRVKRIMNVKNNSLNYGQKLIALVATALILLSIAWLSPASNQNASTAHATVSQVQEQTLNIPDNNIMPDAEPAMDRPVEPVEKKPDNLHYFNKDQEVIANENINTDSIFEDLAGSLPATPPLPPMAPLAPQEPLIMGDDSGKDMVIVSDNDAEFFRQFPQFKIEALQDINFSLSNEKLAKIQKESTEKYKREISALEENLKNIFTDNAKKIPELFRDGKKILVAEKYLQEMINLKAKQKDFQNTQKLLADQSLQLNRVVKEQKRVDSIRTKAIKRKAAPKAIWINNYELPAQMHKQKESLKYREQAEADTRGAYTIDLNVYVQHADDNINAAVYTTNFKAQEEDYSYDYQPDASTAKNIKRKLAKTLTISSKTKAKTITISFQ